MKIYPKDTFEIDSTLSAGEIFSSLDAVVEPPKWFRMWSSNAKIYQGNFSCSNFKIWRIINYRNSFIPIIEGLITPSATGSHIVITMRLHRFVAAFMLFWLGGVTTGVVTFLIAAIRGEMEPILALFIPLGMLLFGITMTSGCFWWEAKKTKPFLIELLKGIEQLPTRK